MKKMQAIVVDDERDSTKLLEIMLKRHCPEVEVEIVFHDSVKACDHLALHQPDVLFLDIEMPIMNGFDLLKKLTPIQFPTIFVTAYNQYALRAFKCAALDYLVKPVDPFELIEAISKAKIFNTGLSSEHLAATEEIYQSKIPIDKIAIPSATEFRFISFQDIIYIEANDNYVFIFSVNGEKHVVSKTLKEIQSIFEESHFLRINRQYLVNLNKIVSLQRNDNIVTLENGIKLPISRTHKDILLDRFNRI
ncbi:MAG: response regulator transcription factor [Bacteroidetes bacterium]|nr:response regulator transcription factor [Bacteroidota bacterium]MBS1740885.1 response regulator transcription factor [Bacteroidota bacterium]